MARKEEPNSFTEEHNQKVTPELFPYLHGRYAFVCEQDGSCTLVRLLKLEGSETVHYRRFNSTLRGSTHISKIVLTTLAEQMLLPGLDKH